MGFPKTGVVAILGLSAMPLLAQEALRYEVRHDHLWKGCSGALTIDARGVSFKSKQHGWSWAYTDIRRLTIAPGAIRVLTYTDDPWKLGADREYRFEAASGRSFDQAYEVLKHHLDVRLVADLADAGVKPLREVPVKLQGRFAGSEGLLLIGEDRIVYQSDKKEQSRTWRYEDVDNISTSGPYQLTLTTIEGAKSFNFQLKQRMEEADYNELWRRLNRRKGTIHLVE